MKKKALLLVETDFQLKTQIISSILHYIKDKIKLDNIIY